MTARPDDAAGVRIIEDHLRCWAGSTRDPLDTLATWFAQVLNGECTIEQTREDCLSVQPAPAAERAEGGGE